MADKFHLKIQIHVAMKWNYRFWDLLYFNSECNVFIKRTFRRRFTSIFETRYIYKRLLTLCPCESQGYIIIILLVRVTVASPQCLFWLAQSVTLCPCDYTCFSRAGILVSFSRRRVLHVNGFRDCRHVYRKMFVITRWLRLIITSRFF